MITAGNTVAKKSKKPFPNGKRVNEVIGLSISPYSGKRAVILEDGNIVDTHLLILVK